MNPTILGTSLVSALATLSFATISFAGSPPATWEETPITTEWCDPATDDVGLTLGLNPVVTTKTGGTVCRAVLGAAYPVLGRDPTIGEYANLVPVGSKETSIAAWTKTWKDWVHADQKRGEALIHAAYMGPFGREATQAEIDYWRPKKGGYSEIFDGNVNWVKSAAGAKERARIIADAYRQAAFERAPTTAEATYWMDHYGKVDVPAACGAGKIDTFDELRCANDEWFWSASSVAERTRVVQDAGLLVCFPPQDGYAIPGSKGTFEPPSTFVDSWVKRILEDRLSLSSLVQTEKFAEKAATFCVAAPAKPITPNKLVR